VAAAMRLPLILAPLVLTSLAACSSSADDATPPAGVEKGARLNANGNTVVASWLWTPASGADETRFRVSRDSGRTFGPTHTLGAWSSSTTVSVSTSGRIAFFYRRVTDPNKVLEGTVATAIEAAFVEPASDTPSTPVTVEQASFVISKATGTSPTIAVTDRAGGGWTLTHYVPSTGGDRLHLLTSSADGATWSSLETGTAFEMPANDTPLFVRCRGTSQRPFFVVRNLLEGRVVVRLEADDGRWPLDRAIEIVAPRAAPGADTTLPGLPDAILPVTGAIRDCSVDGDRIWLLFDAADRTTHEDALWTVGVTLSDAKVSSPTELPGSRKRFFDARLFAEGGRVFAAATDANVPRCDLLTW
jgi:hypothetical protein